MCNFACTFCQTPLVIFTGNHGFEVYWRRVDLWILHYFTLPILFRLVEYRCKSRRLVYARAGDPQCQLVSVEKTLCPSSEVVPSARAAAKPPPEPVSPVSPGFYKKVVNLWAGTYQLSLQDVSWKIEPRGGKSCIHGEYQRLFRTERWWRPLLMSNDLSLNSRDVGSSGIQGQKSDFTDVDLTPLLTLLTESWPYGYRWIVGTLAFCLSWPHAKLSEAVADAIGEGCPVVQRGTLAPEMWQH